MSSGYGGVPVVRDLNLHVGPGEVVALLGPNGAGKTTTLLTISGILKVLDGSANVLGAAGDLRLPAQDGPARAWVTCRRTARCSSGSPSPRTSSSGCVAAAHDQRGGTSGR